MIFEELPLAGAFLVKQERHEDARGSPTNPDDQPSRLLIAGATALVCGTAYLTFMVMSKGHVGPLLLGDQLVVGTVDPLQQQRAHQAALIALALLSIAAVVLPQPLLKRTSFPGSRRFEALGGALLGICLAASISLWTLPTLPQTTWTALFADYYGLWAMPSTNFYVSSIIVACFFLAAIIALGIPAGRGLWAATLVYALLLTLPGLFEPIALDRLTPGGLQGIEWHFDSVFAAKYFLVSGGPTDDFQYSFLFSLLQAIVERRGTFDFASDIRVIQVGNIAFALACLWACYVWNSKSPLIAILTLALVLPWVHNNHQNLFFPNQAGWRFLSFPLMIIVIRHFADAPAWRRVIAFGTTSAFALLWNVETGIAVLLALLVYLAGRAEGFKFDIGARMALQFAVGMGTAIGLIALVYRGGLGSWPDFMTVASYVIERSTAGLRSGYGLPLYFDLLALVIAVFAIWSLLAQALTRSGAPLDARGADHAALAALILVWGSYYVLQPDRWNLWSYLLPFGLLFGDALFGGLKAAIGSRRPGAWPIVPAVIFVLVVGPACAVANWQAVQSVWLGFQIPSTPEAERISGVRLPRTDVERITARLAYLPNVANDARAFTRDSYLLRKLSGRMDLFSQPELAYMGNFDLGDRRVGSAVRAAAPAMVLFDDPVALPSGSGMAAHGVDYHLDRYFIRLQQELADQYRLELTNSGWSIWRRRNGAGGR